MEVDDTHDVPARDPVWPGDSVIREEVDCVGIFEAVR
jgi:hypothetical protein